MNICVEFENDATTNQKDIVLTLMISIMKLLVAWKADGSIVERNDKTGRLYLYYKVKDSHWILYHNKIWMDHHGPIPSKHIISFKDGNTLNCDISNLEMLSMAENARRNTIHRFPDDVKEVIRLKAKLTKKIKQNGKK